MFFDKKFSQYARFFSCMLGCCLVLTGCQGKPPGNNSKTSRLPEESGMLVPPPYTPPLEYKGEAPPQAPKQAPLQANQQSLPFFVPSAQNPSPVSRTLPLHSHVNTPPDEPLVRRSSHPKARFAQAAPPLPNAETTSGPSSLQSTETTSQSQAGSEQNVSTESSLERGSMKYSEPPIQMPPADQ